MPIKSRTKTGRPAEIDRGQLLDAAEKLFAEKGFSGTTTRELVKHARCNLALISYHFGGKDGLYQAVLLRHFERMRTSYATVEYAEPALSRAWPELKDPDQRRFCAAILVLSRCITTDSPMQKIMCREMMTGAAKMAAALDRSEGGAYRLLIGMLEELQKSGKIRKDLELRYCALALIGPVIYSTVAAPILKKVYGFKSVDEDYVRGLCLHQTRVFFEGCGA